MHSTAWNRTSLWSVILRNRFELRCRLFEKVLSWPMIRTYELILILHRSRAQTNQRRIVIREKNERTGEHNSTTHGKSSSWFSSAFGSFHSRASIWPAHSNRSPIRCMSLRRPSRDTMGRERERELRHTYLFHPRSAA